MGSTYLPDHSEIQIDLHGLAVGIQQTNAQTLSK